MVSLASFAENYRKETSKELMQVWMQSLSHLSPLQIAKGTKKCIQEEEFFPTVAKFLELATQHTKQSDRWEDVKPDQEQIEHKRKSVPMPEEYRQLFKKFLEAKSL